MDKGLKLRLELINYFSAEGKKTTTTTIDRQENPNMHHIENTNNKSELNRD